ncbi:MAG: P2 family phage major capsid protein [Escherichia coli]
MLGLSIGRRDHQDDLCDLAVICGRELLSDKYFPLVNKEQENSEKLAADMIISQKRMGGLQADACARSSAECAADHPSGSTLSIYWQGRPPPPFSYRQPET